MRISDLRHFLIVLEQGSITRAAEVANIAQTALGTQIRGLEADLKAPLLRRHARGIEPTEAGRLLYDRAREILRQFDEMRRDVSLKGRASEERISIGAPPSVVNVIGSDLIRAVHQRLPSLQLSLIEDLSSSLVRSLIAHDLQFALAYDPRADAACQRRPVMEERLLFVVPGNGRDGGLALDQPIRLQDALSHELALTSYADDISIRVRSAAEARSLTLQAAFEVRSIEIIKTLISRGIAASFMPFGSIRDELKAGTLFARPVTEPQIVRVLCLVRSPEAAALADEAEFVTCVDRAVDLLADRIGGLARRLPVLE